MRKIFLVIGLPLVFVATGQMSSANSVDQTGLHVDNHPAHIAACERAKAKLKLPGQNTWKNRLRAYPCYSR